MSLGILGTRNRRDLLSRLGRSRWEWCGGDDRGGLKENDVLRVLAGTSVIFFVREGEENVVRRRGRELTSTVTSLPL